MCPYQQWYIHDTSWEKKALRDIAKLCASKAVFAKELTYTEIEGVRIM